MALLFRCSLLLFLCCVCLLSQETVDHSQAAKVIPFNLLTYMPGACDRGQVFVRKDQTPGADTYICGSVNDWHLIGGGSGNNSGGYLFGFPFTYQGTPPDGTALVYSSAAHGWTTAIIPLWKKYTVTYVSAPVAQLTGAVNLFTLAARQKLCGISIYVVTPFTGPTLKTLAISIGDSLDTSPATYTASTFSLTALSSHDYNVMGSIYPGNGTVQANLTATGATLNELTAGVAEIDICTIQQP